MNSKLVVLTLVSLSGAMLLGFFLVNNSVSYEEKEREYLNESEMWAKYREDMSERGAVQYNSTGPGKNIVDYRIHRSAEKNASTYSEEMETVLREPQKLIHEELILPRFDDDHIDRDGITIETLGIHPEWEAIEVGIEMVHFNDQKIPKYFEIIRKVIGDKYNVVLHPR